MRAAACRWVRKACTSPPAEIETTTEKSPIATRSSIRVKPLRAPAGWWIFFICRSPCGRYLFERPFRKIERAHRGGEAPPNPVLAAAIQDIIRRAGARDGPGAGGAHRA